MFRNKRSRSTPPIRTSNQNLVGNATPSAASAAALAFLNKQAADSSLSNAAAAAALRSRVTTPEPVGSLVTRGMIRRGSFSSVAGSPHGSVRQPFQRRGSNASTTMADRTFRSPSPGGPRNGVPSLSQRGGDAPPIPLRSKMRSASVDTGARKPMPSNVGRQVTGTSRPQSAMAHSIQPPTTPTSNKLQQKQATPASASAASRSSVNFSRPMSPPPPAPSARMVQELARTRPASAQAYRQVDQNTGSSRVGSGSFKTIPATGGTAVPALQAAALAARTTTTATIPEEPAKAGFAPGAPAATPARTASTRAATTSKASPATTSSLNGNAAQSPVSRAGLAQPSSPTAASAARPMSPTMQAAAVNGPSAEINVQKRNSVLKAAPPPLGRRISSATSVPSSIQEQRQTAPPPLGRRTSSATSIPSPTQEQIRSFQTRAAAHLARPLADAEEPASQPAPQTVQRSASTLVKPTAVSDGARTRPISQQTAKLPLRSPARAVSISPSRSTHFLDTPRYDGLKHQPLSRAASPAKSAMKSHSPASKSILVNGGSRSDVSDAPSVASDDSSTMMQKKKKKTVNISFGGQSDAVEDVSGPQELASVGTTSRYAILNGQNSDTKEDHKITPTPVLPAFGSVRAIHAPSSESSSLATSTVIDGPAPTRGFSVASNVSDGPVASAERANGEVRTHDFAKALRAETDASEMGASTAAGDLPSFSVMPATPRLGDESTEFGLKQDVTNAPEVRKQAPKPLDMDDILSASDVTNVLSSSPKHSPVSAQAFRAKPSTPTEQTVADYDTDDTAELYEDAEEAHGEDGDPAGFASLDAILESPQAEAPHGIFGANHGQTNVDAVIHQGPADLKRLSNEPVPIEGEDWDEVRAYWSGLSETRKQQIEFEARRAREEREAAEADSKSVMPTSAGSISQTTGHSAAEAQLPPWPDQTYQQASSSKPVAPKSAMKQSMRDSHQRSGSDTTHLRSSMRNESPGAAGFRSSVRDRPMSQQYVTNTAKANGSTVRTSQPLTASALAKTAPKPALPRTFSNDSSGSESSFRKRRPGKGADNGKVSMKRTMRGGGGGGAAAGGEVDSVPSMRGGSRPTSPAPSRLGRVSLRSPSPATSMRIPMSRARRDSVDSTTPTLRGSAVREQPRGSFLGFGKSPRANGETTKSSGRFQSRFADDSSDEEDYGRATGASTWRSRLRESDEEPSSLSLRPVRGIPRKKGHFSGDSTDLSDSDEDRGAAMGRVQAQNLSRAEVPTEPVTSSATQGQALNAGTLREQSVAPSITSSPGKARRGLLGFGKKKPMPVEVPQSTQPAPARLPMPIVGAPVSEELIASGMLSPETTTMTNGASTNPSVETRMPMTTMEALPALDTPRAPLASAPSTPTGERGRRLFRRFSSSANVSPSRFRKEDFPFPPPPIPQEYMAGAMRPSTSDGNAPAPSAGAAGARPTLDKRYSTLASMTPSGNPRPVIVSERTGKKKKFQGLRRLLGVHD